MMRWQVQKSQKKAPFNTLCIVTLWNLLLEGGCQKFRLLQKQFKKIAESATKHFWLRKKPYSRGLLEFKKFNTEMLPSSA